MKNIVPTIEISDVSTMISCTNDETSIMDQNPDKKFDFFYKNKKINTSFSCFEVHSLMNEINTHLRKLIKKEDFFPMMLKIKLNGIFFRSEQEIKLKIELPKKKCYIIWDKDFLEKTFMKIDINVLDFTSLVDNSYDLLFKEIKGFSIKIINPLIFFKEGANYLNRSLGFKRTFDEVLKKKKNESNTVILIYFTENSLPQPQPQPQTQTQTQTQPQPQKYMIGPIENLKNINLNESLVDCKYDIFCYNINENKMEKPKNYEEYTKICIFCKKIMIKTDLITHYKACKTKKIKDDRKKTLKGDIINDVNIFCDYEKFTCRHQHYKCFKREYKPKKQKFIYDKSLKEENSKVYFNDNFSVNLEEKKLKNLNNLNFFTISSLDKQVSDKSIEYLSENQDLLDHYKNSTTTKDVVLNIYLTELIFQNDFSHMFLFKKIEEIKNDPIQELYNLISDSPIYNLRNETYNRFYTENTLDIACEFKNEELLSELIKFPTIDFMKNGLKYVDDPQLCSQLLEMINLKSKEEISKNPNNPFKRYSYERVKNRKDIKCPYSLDENEEFYGVIQCDLEYNKAKVSNDLMKRFAILPQNIWLEFRNPINESLKMNYKMKKFVFEDLNSYCIYSDYLFYLLENEFVFLKRIESFSQFKIGDQNSEFQKEIKKKYENNNLFIYQNMETDFKNIFLDNLNRKNICPKYISNPIEKKIDEIIPFFDRIKNFNNNQFVFQEKKELKFKLFKIKQFIYLSYLNMVNMHSILNFLLYPPNKDNIILRKSVDKNILVNKFTLLHFSISRIIIKYNFIDEETKIDKLKNCGEMTVFFKKNCDLYKLSNIIDSFYFMRSLSFYIISKEKYDKNNIFMRFNEEMYYKSQKYNKLPIKFCKYSILNLPYKIFKNDARYYNRFIYDEGYISKNIKIIGRILHNLRTRFLSDNPNYAKSDFIKFLGVNPSAEPEIFKDHIYKNLIKGMNLDEYGSTWNIDHSIPVILLAFNKNENLLKKIWKYTNLKPMFIMENIKKGSNLSDSTKELKDSITNNEFRPSENSLNIKENLSSFSLENIIKKEQDQPKIINNINNNNNIKNPVSIKSDNIIKSTSDESLKLNNTSLLNSSLINMLKPTETKNSININQNNDLSKANHNQLFFLLGNHFKTEEPKIPVCINENIEASKIKFKKNNENLKNSNENLSQKSESKFLTKIKNNNESMKVLEDLKCILEKSDFKTSITLNESNKNNNIAKIKENNDLSQEKYDQNKIKDLMSFVENKNICPVIKKNSLNINENFNNNNNAKTKENSINENFINNNNNAKIKENNINENLNNNNNAKTKENNNLTNKSEFKIKDWQSFLLEKKFLKEEPKSTISINENNNTKNLNQTDNFSLINSTNDESFKINDSFPNINTCKKMQYEKED